MTTARRRAPSAPATPRTAARAPAARVAAAVASVMIAAVAGCGGTTPNGPAHAGASPKPTPDLRTLTATQILTQSRQALLDAGSFRLKGTVLAGDLPVTIDVRISPANGLGTFTTPRGGFLGMVVDHVAYIRPDDTFWRRNYGPALARTVSGKWLKPAAGDPNWREVLQMFDYHEVVTQVITPQGAVAKGATETVNGQRALALVDHGSQSGTLWIAATGAPYPLLIQAADRTQGKLAFSDFGRPVAPSKPADAQIVDPATLGG